MLQNRSLTLSLLAALAGLILAPGLAKPAKSKVENKGVICTQASSVSAGEVDDFDVSGDKECWFGLAPVQTDDAGDMGAGDGALTVEAFGGSGEGSKLVIYNQNQWTGDYSAVGSSVEISFEANNTGANPISLRIAVGDNFAANPPSANSTWFVTSDAAAVPLSAASGWTTVSFLLDISDMVQALDTTNADADTLADVLAGVAELRILHSTAANHGPGVDAVATTLLIDDIRITQLPVELQSFSVE